MVFSSLSFLYLFLPATLLLYFVLPTKVRNMGLLAASLAFYFFGEQGYLVLMLAEILLTYLSGLLIGKTSGKCKKAVLVLYLVLEFCLLAVFKYAGLFTDTVNVLSGKPVFASLKIHMPIGISFYTFQCASYVIDAYRDKRKVEKNLFCIAVYVSLFPQLIAGPIVRYDDVRDGLDVPALSAEHFGNGAFRFVIGLGKKVLLADRLFAFCEGAHAAGAPSAVLAWAEAIGYLLYVYFDFSGYSDMAIGIGEILGFCFPENFDYPLISRSIREFWRRWHITLGSWFRDYLYIPLGGSRCGIAKHIRNLLIVWALTGLWHGASWNFVVWGLSFGILLVLEMLLSKRNKEKNADAKSSYLRCIPVFLITCLIFVWFRFSDFGEAVGQFGRMFGSAPLWNREAAYYLRGGSVILIASLIGATPIPQKAFLSAEKTRLGAKLLQILRPLWMLVVLGVSTAYLVDGSFSPFLYFRF